MFKKHQNEKKTKLDIIVNSCFVTIPITFPRLNKRNSIFLENCTLMRVRNRSKYFTSTQIDSPKQYFVAKPVNVFSFWLKMLRQLFALHFFSFRTKKLWKRRRKSPTRCRRSTTSSGKKMKGRRTLSRLPSDATKPFPWATS